MTSFDIITAANERAKATQRAIEILVKYPELLAKEPELITFVKLSKKP